MKMKPYKNPRNLATIIYIVIILGLLLNLPTINNMSIINNGSATLNTADNTNPSTPYDLNDNSWLLQTFTAEYYYFRTYSMPTYDYHLIWLYTLDSADDFDLHLFSDPAYTYPYLGGSSLTTQWDWVIYRPSSSGRMYPRVRTYTGVGSGRIEAQSAVDISVGGSTFTCTLSSSEIGELAEVYLYSTTKYLVSLEVPSGCNFDLYVTRVDPGEASREGEDYHYSTSGSGVDEKIIFTPDQTGYYAIVMLWKGGNTGTAALRVDTITALANDVQYYDTYYIEDQAHYYETYTLQTYDRHLFWVATEDISDIDLKLYSDSTYSTQLGIGSGALMEWIVYYPSVSNKVYLKAIPDSGTGHVYIEAEGGYDMSMNSSQTFTLSFSESAELFEVSMSSSKKYRVALSVPSGCDFDLYVFRVPAGTTTKSDYHSSQSSTLGQDESIIFSPATSDYYSIVAIRRSGTGTATLSVDEVIPLPFSYTVTDPYPVQDRWHYYETYQMTADSYHLVWVANASSTIQDVDLKLFSDNKYTNQIGTGAGIHSLSLEWIVYAPTSNVYTYPVAFADSGTGTAFLEAESDVDITLGVEQGWVMGSDNYGVMPDLYLSSSKSYKATLKVPPGCDFDLLTFRVNSGTCQFVDVHTSSSSVLGQDETIIFTPTATAKYAFLIIKRRGNGNAYINVSEYTNNVPTLTDGTVTPSLGDTSTSFTYTVNYTDADNTAPSYIQVVIDGGAPQTMNKQDSGDSTFTDGCIYNYTTTLLKGIHDYYFQASDGEDSVSTFAEIGTGPTVNKVPQLTDGGVSPTIGTTTTIFTYTVNYTDADDDPPEYVQVEIKSGSLHNMTPQDPSDTTYTDGCIFNYSTTLPAGDNEYHFEASDGLSPVRSPLAGETAGPSVNTAPLLLNGKVTPLSGDPSTVFTYSVNYTDADNDTPTYVEVIIDGGTPITMTPQSAGNYTDGCIYEYTTTLAAGVHDFVFNANDGTDSVTFPSINNITGPIVNTPPILSDASYTPLTGTTATTFTFLVNYTDVDNQVPAYIRVAINDNIYDMTSLIPGEPDTTNGAIYTYSTTLAAGTYTYHFSASDGIDTLRYPTGTTNFTGPTVTSGINTAPTLTADSLSPTTGYNTTTFTYSVTYTDVDYNPPSYIRVVIDGTSYDMEKQHYNDTDFTDGCVYIYQTNLTLGDHYYHFEASDGVATVRLPLSGVNSGPTVTEPGAEEGGVPGFELLYVLFGVLLARALTLGLKKRRELKY